MKILILPLLLACGAAGAADEPLAAYRRALIQGDVRSALGAVPAVELPPRDARAVACVRDRFAAPSVVTEAGPAAPFLQAFRRYWHSQMLGTARGEDAQAALLADLNALLPEPGWDRASIDAATDLARLHLERTGLHALTGVTHPYYELMVWKKDSLRSFKVRLPEQVVTVKVVFLDEFLSRGWLSYASCGRYGTGGWTADDTLYALADRYDTQSEEFRVSYLGHEGQHFADKRDFPKLEQAELEYRAKLAELVLASDPLPLLRRFASAAQHGRVAPHPHAEYWLAHDLAVRLFGRGQPDPDWSKAEPRQVQAAARGLLADSTRRARAAGAGAVVRLLPD